MLILSVIIPFYNTSQYLERCVRSLMIQTVQTGIEYIFINDGSTDDSKQILTDTLNHYPERLAQVRYIDLPHNKGVSFARRIGMQEARGEYIIQCDSDDWVEPTLYQLVIDKILKTHADVIVVPFVHEFKDISVVEKYRELTIAECFTEQRWWGLYSHALKRSIVEKYTIYPVEQFDFWEDIDILFRFFVHAYSIAYISNPLYHYDRTRTTSAIHRNVGEHGFLQCKKVIDHLSEYFRLYAPQNMDALVYLKRAARDMYITGVNKDYKKWSRIYPETWRLIWNDQKLSWVYRACYRLGSFGFTFPIRMLFSLANLRN